MLDGGAEVAMVLSADGTLQFSMNALYRGYREVLSL